MLVRSVAIAGLFCLASVGARAQAINPGALPSGESVLPVSADWSGGEANEVQAKVEAAPTPKAFAVRPVARVLPSEHGGAETTRCAPSALSSEEIHALVLRVAGEEDADVKLAEAIATEESQFGQNKVSVKGAIGVMQLMPETAHDYGVDACDAEQNVRGGVRFLKDLAAEFGARNILLIAAAYNAGKERVYAARGVPPIAETVRYVAAVANDYFNFGNALSSRQAVRRAESSTGSGQAQPVAIADSRGRGSEDRWVGSVLFVGQ